MRTHWPLSSLHLPLRPGCVVEMRAVHWETGEIFPQRWFSSFDHAQLVAEKVSPDGYHCWYSINPRIERRAGDAACAYAEAIPADIDAKLWNGDLAAARRAILSCPLPAGIAIASGGGYQPRWLLTTPLDLQDPMQAQRYRTIGARLARAIVGADRAPDIISNPERPLRTPGSLNWKYDPPRPVRVEWCDTSVRHDIDALEAWLDDFAPWTVIPEKPVMVLPERSTNEVIADVNQRFDVPALLLSHGARIGFTHGNVLHFRRPDKRQGTSATWNHIPNVLVVFSSEWPPFQPGRGYDAFEVYSLLEHGGDRRAAYRAAQGQGYGGITEECGLRVRYAG